MRSFVVRRAVPRDASQIREVHQASVRGLCASVYTAAEIEAWIGHRQTAEYSEAMTAGGEMMVVAEYASRVVGFASLRGSEVLAVYVHPDEGRGTGPELLRALETEALRLGIPELQVTSSLNAEAFYRAMGFARVRPSVIGRGQEQLRAVVMSKNLRE